MSQESKWQEIWSRQREQRHYSLNELIEVAGFGASQSKQTVNEFLGLAKDLVLNLNYIGGESIFEVGCGPGAFLLALREVSGAEVSGLDYSDTLVEIANQVLGRSAVVCANCTDLDVSSKVDYVVAHSVFHYLSLDNANETLIRMCSKARRAVAILDVPVLSLRERSEDFRADSLGGKAKYREMYERQGLVHTYFDGKFFESIARESGYVCMEKKLKRGAYPQDQFRSDYLLFRAEI